MGLYKMEEMVRWRVGVGEVGSGRCMYKYVEYHQELTHLYVCISLSVYMWWCHVLRHPAVPLSAMLFLKSSTADGSTKSEWIYSQTQPPPHPIYQYIVSASAPLGYQRKPTARPPLSSPHR